MNIFQKTLGVSAIAATLFLTGCGSTDSDIETQMQAQQYLDKGQYDQAVALLESKTDKTDGDYMMLSSAYMGMAGFSFSDVLKLVAQANGNVSAISGAPTLYKASSATGDSTFLNFLKEIEKKAEANPKVFEYLDAAKEMLDKLSIKTKSAKLNEGLALTMKGSVTLSYMGDVTKLAKQAQAGSDDEVLKNDFVAYGCALAKVYAPAATQPSKCASVTASNTVEVDGKRYTLLTVKLTTSAGEFYKLANQAGDEVMLTSDMCNTLDNSKCIKSDDNSTLVPPLAADGNVTVKNALLQTINDGFDRLIDIAPTDTQDDIRKYKEEIDDNSDGTITADEISAWIEKKSDGQ